MRFPAWSLSGRTCGPAQNQRCLHNSGHRCDQRRNERAQPCRRAGKTSSTNGPALLSAAYGGTPAPRQHTTLPNTATPPGRSRRCSSRGAGRSGAGRDAARRGGAGVGRRHRPPPPRTGRPTPPRPGGERAGKGGPRAGLGPRPAVPPYNTTRRYTPELEVRGPRGSRQQQQQRQRGAHCGPEGLCGAAQRGQPAGEAWQAGRVGGCGCARARGGRGFFPSPSGSGKGSCGERGACCLFCLFVLRCSVRLFSVLFLIFRAFLLILSRGGGCGLWASGCGLQAEASPAGGSAARHRLLALNSPVCLFVC